MGNIPGKDGEYHFRPVSDITSSWLVANEKTKIALRQADLAMQLEGLVRAVDAIRQGGQVLSWELEEVFKGVAYKAYKLGYADAVDQIGGCGFDSYNDSNNEIEIGE